MTKACRYEPVPNRSYKEMARHYGLAIVPARPYRPRDKAKVEKCVQLVEQSLLEALRHERFTSLGELNAAIAALLPVLNAKPFQKRPESRRQLFEELDRPALRPLPAPRHEYAEWLQARVNIDYHVEVHRHRYSVPCELVREAVGRARDRQLRGNCCTGDGGWRCMLAAGWRDVSRPSRSIGRAGIASMGSGRRSG